MRIDPAAASCAYRVEVDKMKLRTRNWMLGVTGVHECLRESPRKWT
jgi:hypothetical protein